jgi:hypothetical protein
LAPSILIYSYRLKSLRSGRLETENSNRTLKLSYIVGYILIILLGIVGERLVDRGSEDLRYRVVLYMSNEFNL